MANDDRYASVAGWDGLDKETRAAQVKLKKEVEQYKLEHASMFTDDSALAVDDPENLFASVEERRTSRCLFGDLFHEGELAILFADTGVGKSTLAVQIADAIARGKNAFDKVPTAGLRCPNDGGRQKVIYVDFELSKAQFAERYSEGIRDGVHYGKHEFPQDTFLRARFEWEDDLPKGFKNMDELIVHSIGQIMQANPDTKVLIVDNITYLTASAYTAGAAIKLMKNLKYYKDAMGISILVLAHSPKRNPNYRLTVNDLQGSKMLANFADSIFTIGACAHDIGVRYIKQIKSRSAEIRYHSDNVITCRIAKENGFLKFVPTGLTAEFEHLEMRPINTRTPKQKISTDEAINNNANDHANPSPIESSIESPIESSIESTNNPADESQRITSPISNPAILTEINRLRSQGTSIRQISRHLNLKINELRHHLGEEE